MQEGVMRLHKHSQELDPAELLDFIEEINQPDQSPLQESGPTEEYEEYVEDAGPDIADTLDDTPLNQAAGESWEDLGEDFGDVIAAEDSSSAVAEELSAEAEEEVQEWDPEAESSGASEDSIRMYLREIGRIRLLSFHDEQVLARRLEIGKYLTTLEQELRGQDGRLPQPSEVTYALLQRLANAAPLVSALEEYLGFSGSLTLAQLASHPELRAAIDGELPEKMLAALAEALEQDQEETYNQLVALSLKPSLLSPEVIDALGDCQPSQLDSLLSDPDCYVRLLQLEPLLRPPFQAHPE
jgi:Sigma-70 factor, region 1.2